jgi:UDP-N-acetylmuramyl pentapeptide phosphotransferase/UDP-N-acetylglucosamine-1-phosphate transferase
MGHHLYLVSNALFVIVFLFLAMIFYLKVANKYNIIDIPNQRSSHNYLTIRGGGIVFWLAGLLYSVFIYQESFYFLIGLTLICAVSFWDDVSSLPNKVRILIHFFSVSLIFHSLGLFSLYPWWLILITFIFFVGIMNAYNFMDGINGITGLYSLAILIGLQYVNYWIVSFANPNFINYAILACLVFLFFNYRRHAKCFAGDIGSLGISFWIVTLLLQLMLKSNSFIWMLFLAVYGIDSIYTVLHRLYLKQNIFEAHRLHFYQVLSNEKGISHLKVSALYAFVQLIVCEVIIYFYNKSENWIVSIGIIGILSLVYLLKFRF